MVGDFSIRVGICLVVDVVVVFFGELDIFVNFVGINIWLLYLEIMEDDWDVMMMVNVFVLFLFGYVYVWGMVECGYGCFIYISL